MRTETSAPDRLPGVASVYLLFIALLTLFAVGCGSSSWDRDFGQVPPPPTDPVFRVALTDLEPDLEVDGHPVREIRVLGYGPDERVVFGPQVVPYPDSSAESEELLFPGFPSHTARVQVDFKRAPGYALSRIQESVDFPADDDGQIELSARTAVALGSDRSTVSVRLRNDSDYPDDQVFVAINGKDRIDSAFSYIDVDPVTHRASIRRFGPVADWSQYSFPLTALLEGSDGTYSLDCPVESLVSGRIYVSFGAQLQGIGLNDPADPLSLRLPSPTGAPDAQTVFEFMELSVTSPPEDPTDRTLYANTSVVDYFSVGLGMTLYTQQEGQERTESVGFVPNAREQVLAAFEEVSTPEPFRQYVRSENTGSILRVLSPVQGVALQPNGPLASFLDQAIEEAWNHYAQQALNIPDNLPALQYGYRWTGQPIQEERLTMTCVAKPPGDTATGDLESLGEVCRLPKPTSRIVFFCDDDAPLPPGGQVRDSWKNDGSQGHKRLVSLLSSALNRGVVLTYADWDRPETFYTRPDGLYNHYSKIMHRFALNGKVYGFGYDDVYGQDPTLVSPLEQVNRLELSIPSFPRL